VHSRPRRHCLIVVLLGLCRVASKEKRLESEGDSQSLLRSSQGGHHHKQKHTHEFEVSVCVVNRANSKQAALQLKTRVSPATFALAMQGKVC